ncbi:MAG TPA: acyl-ACP--UDP-N-acetylglucosamine O-acyltransferase [bacterium]|nr:acyl-ACP--UDP-N-acetylglucosamine O-acyltransferase [bacterium]
MAPAPLGIHPTSLVDPAAKLGPGVSVGPYSIIGPYVEIGEGTEIGAHCVVVGHTRLGKKNRVFTGAVVGSEPQDVKFQGETTFLEIGDENIIREYATLNPGTGEGSKTVIGNRNWIMIQAHVGHNCVIQDDVKLANGVMLGGHAVIEDHATVGGGTPVHQFVRIGRFAMIGGGFRVVQDIVPYMIAGDEPLKIYGVNQVGLERNGFSKDSIEALKQAHKIIFRKNLTLKEAMAALKTELPGSAEVGQILEFLALATRGIVR